MVRFQRALTFVCVPLLSVGLAPPARAQGGSASRIAAIPASQVAAIVPKVRGIRAEPATITLRVGQTVGLNTIAVIVLDSLGKVRGRLPGYDFAIPPGQAASAVPFKITGQKPGTAELTIHFPKRQWAPRTDPRPEAKVRIIVKP